MIWHVGILPQINRRANPGRAENGSDGARSVRTPAGVPAWEIRKSEC